jgi:deazaflavin-dependent oxidoreductase (nitroreductase family)
LDEWFYRGGRPNRVARLLNRGWARLATLGVAPARLVTLEVDGRRTHRPISFPVVVADRDGEQYLVSMLGADTNWVKNVRAAGGDVILSHRGRRRVHLEEVPVDQRAPMLRRYLECAPGARAHLPLQSGASVAEFERIASDYPVFHVVDRT